MNKWIFLVLPIFLFANPFQLATKEKFETFKTLCFKTKLPLDPHTELHNFCKNNKDFALVFDQNKTPLVFIKQYGKTLLLEESVDDVCFFNHRFVFLKQDKVFVLEHFLKEIPFDVAIKKAFLEKYFPKFNIEQKENALWITKNSNFEKIFVLDFFNPKFPKHNLIGSIDELQYFLDNVAIVIPLNKHFTRIKAHPIPFQLFQKQSVLKKVHMHLDPLLDSFYAFFPEICFSMQKHLLKVRESALKKFINTHYVSFAELTTKQTSKNAFCEKTYLEEQDINTFLSYEILDGFLKLAHVEELLIPKIPTLFVKVLGFRHGTIKPLKKPPFSKVDLLNFWKSVCITLMLGAEESFEKNIVFTLSNKSVVCRFDICSPLKFDWEKRGFFQKTRFFSKENFLQKSPFFYKLGARKMPFFVLDALNQWLTSIDTEKLIKWLQSFKSRNIKENTLEPYFSKRDIAQFKYIFFKLKSTLFEAKVNKKRLTLLEFAKNVRPDLE